MKAVRSHPWFNDMVETDFKTSPGDEKTFTSLAVGVHEEACPMGVSPELCSYTDSGTKLSPEQWHESMQRLQDGEEENCILVDCRNYYEMRVGKFEGAVTPDIRKFSYWPEYVDKNAEMFRGKKVYMYCTGGARCERGSAYIINKGLTSSVFHLHGGIHRYMEKYPDGHFRGNLFVFDERYGIMGNEVISKCIFCSEAWDKYEPCSSSHCHQLVLSCTACRNQGNTTCCHMCKQNAP